MQSGEGGRWRAGSAVLTGRRLAVVLCLLAGCAGTRPHVDQAMKAEAGGPARNEGVAERYVVRCPDVLDVTVAGRPDLTARAVVAADGRVDLGSLGDPRVEGQTTREIARTLAVTAGMPAGSVRVRVAGHNSQHVYLFGEVFGLHRAVPYQGPETVLDLLQRVGGITPEAAPGDVYVIRPHVIDGKAPEVFHIDLRAILFEKDQGTNLRVQPFDQVHVGQTRQAVFEKALPPWLRPAFHSLAGLRRPPGARPEPGR
jgi:protein involved in polysaccharide export with SLBB domain